MFFRCPFSSDQVDLYDYEKNYQTFPFKTCINISVNYNSMGGNSILGMGWSIGGLSAISRANSNIYYDNVTKTPTFSSTDAFVLS